MTDVQVFLVGLTKDNGQYKWYDGTVVTWIKWKFGAPNLHNGQNCAQLDHKGFNYRYCSGTGYFLCEVMEGKFIFVIDCKNCIKYNT